MNDKPKQVTQKKYISTNEFARTDTGDRQTTNLRLITVTDSAVGNCFKIFHNFFY